MRGVFGGAHLYSRIATPDLHEENERPAVETFMDGFFTDLGYRSVAWLTPFERDALHQQIQDALAKSGEHQLSKPDAEALIRALPSEADAIADRVISVLAQRGLLAVDDNTKRKARNFLLNDSEYKKLAKR